MIPPAWNFALNVPAEMDSTVWADLAGYHAHCTALDDMDLRDNTVILFTSDHGDLLGSHHAYKKQQPYEESIRVPMLIHHPGVQPR